MTQNTIFGSQRDGEVGSTRTNCRFWDPQQILTWDPSLSDSDRERSKLRFGGCGRQEAVGKGMLRHVCVGGTFTKRTAGLTPHCEDCIMQTFAKLVLAKHGTRAPYLNGVCCVPEGLRPPDHPVDPRAPGCGHGRALRKKKGGMSFENSNQLS